VTCSILPGLAYDCPMKQGEAIGRSGSRPRTSGAFGHAVFHVALNANKGLQEHPIHRGLSKWCLSFVCPACIRQAREQFANLVRTWIKLADDLERTLAFVDALNEDTEPQRRTG
jgi:hypothetical protein